MVCLHEHGDRPLQRFILKGGHPNRPRRTPFFFGDIRPPHRWGHIRAGLQAVKEARKIALQILAILGRGLSINACCAVLTSSARGFLKEGYVEVMRQGGQPPLRRLVTLLRSPGGRIQLVQLTAAGHHLVWQRGRDGLQLSAGVAEVCNRHAAQYTLCTMPGNLPDRL
jgi:hypothetical protein